MPIFANDYVPETGIMKLVKAKADVHALSTHKQDVEFAMRTQNVAGVTVSPSQVLNVTDSMTLSSPLIEPGPTVVFPASGTVPLLGVANVYTQTQTVTLTDAGTTNQAIPLIHSHATSATPAAGFGVTELLQAHASTNVLRALYALAATWTTATDASRKSRVQLLAYDTAAREGLRIEGSGTAPLLSFYGAVAVARAAALTAANADVINSGDATTDAVITNMKVRIAELELAVKNIGITL